MGHTASTTRNNSAAIGICLLALAPQIFELVWSFGTIFGLGTGRGPAQVLLAHGTALLSAAPTAVSGSFGANAKKAFSSEYCWRSSIPSPVCRRGRGALRQDQVAAGLYSQVI
jgi:hypothetical protein